MTKPKTKTEKIKAKLVKHELPTQEELYENPIQEIVIKPEWWDSEGPVMEFMIKYLTGFLWEVKFGHKMVAIHRERDAVERLLHQLEFLEAKDKKDEWWPTHDEEFQLALFEWARLVPMMWD